MSSNEQSSFRVSATPQELRAPPRARAASEHPLTIDPQSTLETIERRLRAQVVDHLRRRGAVLGLSGGVDSSVVAAICVRTFGRDRVLGLFMPERDSSTDALRLGRLVAAHLGIAAETHDLSPTLAALGCYERQIEAIRTVFPAYGDGWRCKVTLPSILDGERMNVSLLTVESPDGQEATARMTRDAYLQLVAATSFKQRARKMLEYYHADRLRYAVAGTPNRLEYDQGFFVKQGDGAADVKPIAHLYKTQVYALAEHLGIPREITSRPPTTDTFSMPQTQEEFYFALDHRRMDRCLHARNGHVPPADVAAALGLAPEQVERIYRDIDSKRRATRYLHEQPLLIEPVPEV